MSNRRSFLRDCLLGLAVSLVPRVLQPSVAEVEDVYDGEKLPKWYTLDEPPMWQVWKYDGTFAFGVMYRDDNGHVSFKEVGK